MISPIIEIFLDSCKKNAEWSEIFYEAALTKEPSIFTIFFKREKASARASSDRFLPILKSNIQNNAINCTNLGKQ